MRQPRWITTFKEAVKKDEAKHLKDYHWVEQKVNKSTARYQGKPMRFSYQPMLFDAQQIQVFESLSQTLVGILKKVISAYRTKEEIRNRFGFSKEMERLILANPGYSCDFPVARFDLFYDFITGDFKFCELNADGTSSMNEARELSNILTQSQAIDAFKSEYLFEQDELFDSWIDTVIALYRESKGKEAKQNPTIMIADFEGDGITSEFEIFKQRFERRGYPTQIGDPSELVYKENQLWLDDKVVDIIYRRATTGRIVDNIDCVQEMLHAYYNNHVCIVGGFVSQLIHNKVLFALLHDPECFDLTDEERAYINQHIPYTTFLSRASAKTLKDLKQNKNQYLLKPFDQYAAHGIRVGKNYSNDEWEKIIDQCRDKDYLIQEFYDVPKLNLCTKEDGRLTFKPHRHMIGLFMYKEKFVGTYIRVGKKPIIATHGGESLTMVGFRVKKK